jgi:hypothetical protein
VSQRLDFSKSKPGEKQGLGTEYWTNKMDHVLLLSSDEKKQAFISYDYAKELIKDKSAKKVSKPWSLSYITLRMAEGKDGEFGLWTHEGDIPEPNPKHQRTPRNRNRKKYFLNFYPRHWMPPCWHPKTRKRKRKH